MTVPFVQDLDVVCGNDVLVPVQLYDSETGTDPLDLTGVTAISYVARRHWRRHPIIIEKELAAGIQVVGATPADGQIEIAFDAEDTTPGGRALRHALDHELLVVDVAGNRSTVFAGRLNLQPSAAIEEGEVS